MSAISRCHQFSWWYDAPTNLNGLELDSTNDPIPNTQARVVRVEN